MDPVSTNCYNLHNEESKAPVVEEQVRLKEIVVSCKSLSYYDSKSFKTVLPQVIATAAAACLHVVVGICLTYSAVLIPQLQEAQNGTDADAIHITKEDSSWITSCITLVALVSSICGGFIMDAIGRLNLLKLTAIPGILGWVLIATAANVPMLLIGRLLTGITIVWGVSPAAVYATEIGRPDIRGSLNAMLPCFISVGMVLLYLKGWFLNWRTIAWLCNIYTIIPVILMLFIPESPAWLMSKGRTEEARKALNWFHRYQPQPQHKSGTFAEMQFAVLQKEHLLKMEERERMDGGSFLKKVKMFFQPIVYKPLLILTGLFTLQQFSGIYIILFNGVLFFKDIGTEIDPYMASIFLGVMRLIVTTANTWLMKRYNRRSLLIVSAAAMAICMGISGLYTKLIQEGTTTQQWVPLVMLMTYFIMTAMGLMTIPFAIIAELFPIAVRGIAHSIVMSLTNLTMFAALKSYYTLYNFFGGSSGLQYFFGTVSLAAMIYAYVFLPETHGKKLSEIEEYFWHHTTYLSVPSQNIKSEKDVEHSNIIHVINNNNMVTKNYQVENKV